MDSLRDLDQNSAEEVAILTMFRDGQNDDRAMGTGPDGPSSGEGYYLTIRMISSPFNPNVSSKRILTPMYQADREVHINYIASNANSVFVETSIKSVWDILRRGLHGQDEVIRGAPAVYLQVGRTPVEEHPQIKFGDWEDRLCYVIISPDW